MTPTQFTPRRPCNRIRATGIGLVRRKPKPVEALSKPLEVIGVGVRKVVRR